MGKNVHRINSVRGTTVQSTPARTKQVATCSCMYHAYVFVSVCMSMSVYLYVCMSGSICLSVCLSVCMYIWVCLSVYLSVCMYVCM